MENKNINNDYNRFNEQRYGYNQYDSFNYYLREKDVKDNVVNNKKKTDRTLKIYLITVSILLVTLLLTFAVLCVRLYNEKKINLFNLKNNTLDHFLNNLGNDNNPNYDGTLMQIEDTDKNENDYMSAEKIYSMASPSIVGVVIYDQKSNVTSDPKGEGSGIIMSENGYIITNSHVIGDSKSYRVKVVLSHGTEYPAAVVGYDTRTDLAVIKVDTTGLPAARFGDSDKLAVGSWVIAIGNPGGLDFANSLTRGSISALNRSVSASQSLVKYIQTDAAINPGNSGGALLNMYGQVIGINTSKIVATGYEGIGFAIPVNTAKQIINDIISNGYVSGRVKLGITGKLVTNYQSNMYKVPQGIVIVDISNESDLSANGVKAGDIITKINDVNVTGFDVLYTELTHYKEGDKVKLTLYRPATDLLKSSTFETTVTLLADKGESQK